MDAGAMLRHKKKWVLCLTVIETLDGYLPKPRTALSPPSLPFRSKRSRFFVKENRRFTQKVWRLKQGVPMQRSISLGIARSVDP